MPQLLAAAIAPLLISAGIGAATASVIALGIGYVVTAVATYAITALLVPKPAVPKPDDGKYNLKQAVPPLSYALGRVKKGGDYVLLEESAGFAYHITTIAAHPIQGFVTHYLHDEAITLAPVDGTITAPAHFDGKVRINTRQGADRETAYGVVTAALPSIWGPAHRGDGLASVMMRVSSVRQEDFQKTFPMGMPVHTAILDGHSRIYDPRTGLEAFTRNLALFRLWHLTSPVGGKLDRSQLYMPDWSNAADVCDQIVTNRSGANERRYWGGFWFRADNDPVQVGFLIDQAAELVVYERGDGLVGVHAGAMVTPDIRLTRDDILSIQYDPNKRRSSSVIAVRGRYTGTTNYSTEDAAIYGDPYASDDERTKTVDNQAVQSHNHIARLQKLAYIRANAPRVSLSAHFDPARLVPYRRFIKVHCPPFLNEATIELTGRPTLSLTAMTYRLEGIVVPPNLYAFDAATEEGAPGTPAVIVPRDPVPVPTGFAVAIVTSTVGGAVVKAARGSWTLVDSTFTYELAWQPTAGGAEQSVTSIAPQTSVTTPALADATSFRFRLRTWSGQSPSDWTGYITLST